MKKLICLTIFTITILATSQNKKMILKHKSIVLDTLSINTKLSDFGVNFISDTTIVFSSPKKTNLFTRKWEDNSQAYLELYIGQVVRDNGAVVNVEKYSKELNSRYHEAQVAITKDGKHAYFTSNNHINGKGIKGKGGYNNLQLYKADIVNGIFENIKLLPFNNPDYSTGHPFLGKDDKTLYFISDMPGGYGQTDIYRVSILEDDTYIDLVNLGSKINTKKKEMFPFLDIDNVLYFASDRKKGLGGLDVYGVSLDDKYLDVYHLPSPINTKKDDFSFVMSASSVYGFLSSNREGGVGDDDIYKIKLNCEQYLKGKVTKRKEKNIDPLEKAYVFIYKDSMLIDSLKTNLEGCFESNKIYECGESYIVKASKEGYTKDSLTITVPSLRTNVNELTLNLQQNQNIAVVPSDFVKNERGVLIINIEDILFDFDKSDIRTDAALILDKVVSVMKRYPNIVVEGGSHTDSRGSKRYNKKLSSKRAKSTVTYIIDHGISSKRISSKGYGESKLVNNCNGKIKCSEEEHQLNRRTEFVVLKQ